MLQLILLTLLLVAISVGIAILLKFKVKTEKGKYIALLIAGCLTVLVHYSSLIYHLIADGECTTFLNSNPNLILPIYPCNVTMICCLIYGIKKYKDDSFAHYLADYCFFFGSVSSFIGMLANVDFINNPTLLNYDVTKGIVAHGTMFFNAILILAFGYIKIDIFKNVHRFGVAIIMMCIVGLYDSAIIWAFGGADSANNVNSMFLLHSPFDGLDFVIFPVIAGAALVALIIILIIVEAIIHRKDKENIWYRRMFKHKVKANENNQ